MRLEIHDTSRRGNGGGDDDDDDDEEEEEGRGGGGGTTRDAYLLSLASFDTHPIIVPIPWRACLAFSRVFHAHSAAVANSTAIRKCMCLS